MSIRLWKTEYLSFFNFFFRKNGNYTKPRHFYKTIMWTFFLRGGGILFFRSLSAPFFLHFFIITNDILYIWFKYITYIMFRQSNCKTLTIHTHHILNENGRNKNARKCFLNTKIPNTASGNKDFPIICVL